MNSNIVKYFLQASKLQPTKIAILDAHKSITFSELENKIIAKANYYKTKNINAGDRVLVFIPMNTDLYINVLALFYIGATAVFLDEWVSIKRLKVCCELAECKAIIAGWKIKILRFFVKPLRTIPVFLNANTYAQGNAKCHEASATETALITFTTGSTGIPKAANRTHAFLHAQFEALKPLLDEQQNRIDMPMLPIVLLLNLGIGRTSVIANFKASKPSSFNAATIAKQIIQHNVSSITASPFYLLQLAKHCQHSNVQLPLQKIIAGGSAVYPKDAKMLMQYVCSNTLIVYGSTEAEPIAHCNAAALVENYFDTKNGLYVGEMDANAKVQIIQYTKEIITANNLQAYVLATGLIGEIIVSGKHVLDAYFKNENAFAENKIIDEQNILWHRTGDMGYVNNANELFLLGRCKQAIIINEQIIYPFIVEDALQNIADISIGTIIESNEKLHVFVETNNNTNSCKHNIDKALQALQIANYQLHFVQIARDPRHNSKIDYEKLEKQIC